MIHNMRDAWDYKDIYDNGFREGRASVLSQLSTVTAELDRAREELADAKKLITEYGELSGKMHTKLQKHQENSEYEGLGDWMIALKNWANEKEPTHD